MTDCYMQRCDVSHGWAFECLWRHSVI